MQASEFRDIRLKLGLEKEELAEILNVGMRTINRWEADPGFTSSRRVDPTAAQVMGWMEMGYRPPGFPKAAGSELPVIRAKMTLVDGPGVSRIEIDGRRIAGETEDDLDRSLAREIVRRWNDYGKAPKARKTAEADHAESDESGTEASQD